MKNKLLAIIILVCTTGVTAQNVGVGTNTPHASAKLDIQASNMGILIPQVDLNTVSFPAPGPATGLLVWNSNAGFGNGVGFYYNFGTTAAPSWLKVADTGSVNDADADPNNEIQTIGKSGSTVTLSNGGGSFTDEVNDADANPSNELQSLSQLGTTVSLSNGGGSVSVADNDNNSSNELQTISKSGSTVSLSGGGGSFTDAVNDADADPNNEIQALSISGSTVSLSNGGGSVTVPSSADNLGDHSATTTLDMNGNPINEAVQINSSAEHLEFMTNRTDDNTYEWAGFYSGGTRQGIILYDGAWTGANNRTDEFSITSENNNKLTLNTSGNSDIALMPKGTGNVGIGTTTPSQKLEVFGNIRSTGNYYLNNSSPTIYLQDSDNETGMIHMNSNLLYFLSGSGNNTTSWATNGSRWPLTINMANDVSTFGGAAHFMEGNVGIGTEAPGYNLDVKGNIYADGGWMRVSGNQGLYFESHGTGIHSVTADAGQYGSVSTYGNEGGWEGYSIAGNYVLMASGNSYGLYNDVDNRWAFLIDRGLNNDGYRFFNSNTGALNMRIQHTNGSNYASYDGDNNWDFYSDKRLKENIEKEANILDRVLKLDVVNYDFINQDRKDKEIGFIAQEVEKYFPSLVSESSDERYDFDVKALGYSSFGVLAIGALKELKLEKDQELDNLNKTIDELNTKIDLQQKQINELIERIN